MEWLLNNYEAIIGLAVSLILLLLNVVSFIKAGKRVKAAKTDTERANALEGLKLRAFGLITATEDLFKGISKSGSSKLLYVLNNLEKVAGTYGVEFDEEYWTDFINTTVAVCNNVADDKAYERAVPVLIEQIKQEVPFYIKDANKLFEVIPDSSAAKLEYILKLISNSCAKNEINVYDLYDWKTYVNEQLNAAA